MTTPGGSRPWLAAVLFALTLGWSGPAGALPPYDHVLEQLSRFRSGSGDWEAAGELVTESGTESVQLERVWGTAALLRIGDQVHELDWRRPELLTPMRLLGAVLGAMDLPTALGELGRPLQPEVQTLAWLDDEVVYVLGGALGALTAHVLVERSTFRLRRVRVPFPEGEYVVDLDDYRLAEGWVPARITVRLDGRQLLLLTLQSVARR